MPRSWGPVRWFVLVALLLGTAFAFVVPPFVGYDEPLHFLRAWEVGEGRVFSVEDPDTTIDNTPDDASTDKDEGLGGRFPAGLRAAIIELIEAGAFTADASFIDVYSHLDDRAPSGGNAFIGYPSAAVYSPIPYVPSALAIDLGRVLNLSTLASLMLARMAGLVAYVGIVALAIRRLPARQWVLATLALAPVVVFQAATVTADTVTVALAVLLVADALRIAALPPGTVPARLLVETTLVAVALALCKQPYILVAAFLVVPAWRHRGRVAVAIAGAGAVAVAVGLIWASWASANYTEPTQGITTAGSYAYRDVDAEAQLEFVRAHPLDFLEAIGTSLGDDGIDYARDALGQTGGWNTPWPLVIMATGALVLALLIDASRLPMAGVTISIALVIAVVTFGALFLLGYAGWNAVEAPRVDEFQGRYLFPVVAVLALTAVPALPSAERIAPSRRLRAGRAIVAADAAILVVVAVGITRAYW